MSAGVIRLGVASVALRGPGLTDWTSSQPVLTGTAPYHPAATVLDSPARLSPAERRRAVPAVKLALGVGAAAVEHAGLDPAGLQAVFASSGADGETIVAILAALATPSREVSPTRFHNSVHNAPSGYWGIAMQSREAVTSVSCYDASFAAGLLEAGVQAVAGERPILLVAYDLPYPDPLDQARHIEGGFGVAFVLLPAPLPGALAELHLSVTPTGDATSCPDPALEALRRTNPAARSLPLLAALAASSATTIQLDLSQGTLNAAVTPC
jgi:lambda repressor-like predicted transcriptional regulator